MELTSPEGSLMATFEYNMQTKVVKNMFLLINSKVKTIIKYILTKIILFLCCFK